MAGPTKARIGFGAKFYVETAPTGAAAAPLLTAMSQVGETFALSEPSRTKDTVDATHMNSEDMYREFLAGIKDGGEVTVEYNRISGVTGDVGQAAIAGAFEFQGAVWVFMDIPLNPVVRWSLRGICTSDPNETPMDDKMTGSATFKVTGKPVLAAVV